MKPTKGGQIAKFYTPLADEDPEQLYVVLEVIEDDERPRADVQALNKSLPFPPINKVRIDDLEVVEVITQDLIGHYVTINKSDYSQVEGRVSNVSEHKIEVTRSNGVHGVETNFWLTIIDNNGVEHLGTLFVSPE